MTKKEVLELLIRIHGLEPKDVSHYHTDSCGGQFQNGIGWEGAGIDKEGKPVIGFMTPEGFEDAVRDILLQGRKNNLPIVLLPKSYNSKTGGKDNG